MWCAQDGRGAIAAGGLAVLAVGAVLWVIAGAGGLLYALIYGLGTAPGWPLGWRLFGRQHAAGWIAGAVLGYALLTLSLWAATTLFGLRSAAGLIAVWLAITGVLWLLVRPGGDPVVGLPTWRHQDSAALLLVLLLVPAVFLFPYRNLGAADASGTRYYRAYFTADYLWHMALTAELSKYTSPPMNPYMASAPLHYYWTYFVLPAAASRFGPTPVADTEVVLKAGALCTAVLLLAALFVFAWSAIPVPTAVAVGVLLVVAAASAEGAYGLLHTVWIEGRPLASVRDLNVDALSNWHFHGLRIDSLVRSMWYTPQHSMAVALGLIALTAAGFVRAPVRWGAVWLAGLALGASTSVNPLLGGVFSLVYGGVVLLAAVRLRAPLLVPGHALAAIPVAGGLGWCFMNQMVEGAGTTLHFGIAAFARHRPVLTFVLSLGPALVAALWGLTTLRAAGHRLGAALLGLVAGVGLLYFVVLLAETSYVGFRAGQIIQVSLAVLASAGFARGFAGRRRLATWSVAGLLIVLGLPTTVIDTFNAQDIRNTHPGPGFRWVIETTPDEREAYAWIRARTSRTAVVQMDALVRARETWTQVPAFAERRMAAGLPISLIATPAYEARSRLVHHMYVTADADEAWSIARSLGITYVYLDRIEREGLPAGFERKFETRPDRFDRVFANGEARVYRVRVG